jgi:hypothetical protein
MNEVAASGSRSGVRHLVTCGRPGGSQQVRLGSRPPASDRSRRRARHRAHAPGDVIEAVERRLNPSVLRSPVLGRLLLVAPAAEVVAKRLGQVGGRLAIALARRRALHERRPRGEILQVALADQRRAVTGVAQQLDEGHRIHRQRNAVRANAMDRRHSPGHQARAIGHADRARDVEPVERRAARRNRIDMRRAQHRMTIAAEEVRAVLVGDEQKEVRTGGAGGSHVCTARVCELRNRDIRFAAGGRPSSSRGEADPLTER